MFVIWKAGRRRLAAVPVHVVCAVALALLASLGAGHAVAQTPPNSPATGIPSILGTGRVGETLTASQGTIADTNGLTSATFTYQWIRVDGQNESDITGATGTTYLLTASDPGKRIKVRASFTDDDGNSESRTSDGFPESSSGLPIVDPIPACPAEVAVPSSWELTPAGLVAGDRFRLIFVTSGNYSPQQIHISYYNALMSDLVRAGHTAIRSHASGFRLLGSTPTVDARENTCSTGTGVPIYWLNGNKVADDYGDFYDGSWDDETGSNTQSGNFRHLSDSIWTGTQDDGTAAALAVLGRKDRNLTTRTGRLNYELGGPLASGLEQRESHVRKPYYAMSQVFVVKEATPLEDALVSNFEQMDGHKRYNVLSNASQSFTTGTNAGGYYIEQIVTKINQSKSFALSLCTADSRGRPTSTCTPFTPPSVFKAGPVVFGAPARTLLNANTTYAVVLSDFHNRLILDYTPSGGEDAGAADGWSIGDAYDLWHPGSRSWHRRSGVILRLGVGGSVNTLVTVPGAPRNLTATATGPTRAELNWDAPSSNGGAAITDYEIRHQHGGNPATAWASAGTDRTEAVTGLTTGQQYSFDVRAVNSAGSGSPATVQATVTSAATFTTRFANLPEHHRGAADRLHYSGVGTNDFTFELHFSLEPPNLSYKDVPDLLEVSGGEVLKARRLNPPSNLAWEVPIRPTQNGDIGITLPSRECTDTNAVCADGQKLAAAVSATVRGRSFSASFSRVPPVHDGSPTFTLAFSLSHEPDPMSFVTVRNSLFDVTGGAIEYVRRVRRGQNREWELRVRPSSLDDVTLTLRETTACDSPPGICAGGQKLPGGLTVTVPGPATLSISDAQATEGPSAVLQFDVELSKARSSVTTVQYATSDGTATAGADYESLTGTLTFAPGEVLQTIVVTVLEDAIDDGGETMTVTLSNPTPSAYVRISDGTATGTINNSDPMPQAWITRFGRTVGSQVVDAVSGRVEGTPGRHVTVGGMNLVGTSELAEEEPVFELRLPDWNERRKLDAATKTMTTEQMVLGSSFHLSTGKSEGGYGALSAWGRFVTGGFEAQENDVVLDGDVTTGMLGVDGEWESVLAGVLVTQSSGEGSYRLVTQGAGGGEVESTMTGVYPYARMDLNARVSAWGVLGIGLGDLTLRTKTGDTTEVIETDLGMRMGAVGLRGRVLDGTGASGIGLNLRSDVMWVSTESDKTNGMMGAEGEVSRLRLIVAGRASVRDGRRRIAHPKCGARGPGRRR